MELNGFLFDALPSVLGLLIVIYFFSVINRMKGSFLKLVTSWIIVGLMLGLVCIWLSALATSVAGNWLGDARPSIVITMTVYISWLSVFMTDMATISAKFNDIKTYYARLKRSPANLTTAWGTVGLVVIALTWYSQPGTPHLLKEHTVEVLVPLGYVLFSICIMVFGLFVWTGKGRMPVLTKEARAANVMFAIAWAGLPSTLYGLDLVGNIGLGYEGLNPYVWMVTLLGGLFLRTVLTTQFMAISVDSGLETVRREGFRAFDIPRGVYLIHDEKADSAFGLFSELVTLPLTPSAVVPGKEESATATLEFLIPRGLVVTRDFPEKVREKHHLEVTPIIWLTESPGERRIAPTSLAVLTDTIIRFMETNPNSIVLLEGIEYIMTFNEFRKVLRSLDSLNETAWITKGRLLISVNPKAFDERELALLERDRNVIKGQQGIETLKKESKVSPAAA